ncbi:amidase domain-containing protein [Kitasatospora aureofaciens]|uniref:amidase domain-containing protein n=1 Tax=Kitasatospora aureofaciens TaxID=1894 RepID=UPI0037C745B4
MVVTARNSYGAAAAVFLTDVVVDQQTAGKVVVRATVKDSVTIRSGGADSPSESVGAKRFEFTVGTADWARRNVNIGWDFPQDCTNFVSKALYYGGGMRPRYGFKTWDGAWWTNDYWLFGWHKNRSYTWAGTANLHRHLLNYRYSTWLRWTSQARPGDVVFFKWRDEPRINHAAVVVSWGARMELRQHGHKGVTTLNEVLSYYRQKGGPIEWFVVVRPLGTN